MRTAIAVALILCGCVSDPYYFHSTVERGRDGHPVLPKSAPIPFATDVDDAVDFTYGHPRDPKQGPDFPNAPWVETIPGVKYSHWVTHPNTPEEDEIQKTNWFYPGMVTNPVYSPCVSQKKRLK